MHHKGFALHWYRMRIAAEAAAAAMKHVLPLPVRNCTSRLNMSFNAFLKLPTEVLVRVSRGGITSARDSVAAAVTAAAALDKLQTQQQWKMSGPSTNRPNAMQFSAQSALCGSYKCGSYKCGRVPYNVHCVINYDI